MNESPRELGVDAARVSEESRSLDEIFDALSNAYARYTLYYLSEHRETDLDELAEAVAGIEAMVEDTVVSPEKKDLIRLRLYHAILPKLASIGFVDFDEETHGVSRGAVPEDVSAVLGIETS